MKRSIGGGLGYLAVTMALLAVALPVAALWHSNLWATVTVSTGSVDPKIVFHAGVITSCHCTCHCSACGHSHGRNGGKCCGSVYILRSDQLYVSRDGKSLILNLNLGKCGCGNHSRGGCGGHDGHDGVGGRGGVHTILIAAVVRNLGTIPVKVVGVRITDQGSTVPASNWGFEAIYYGPFNNLITLRKLIRYVLNGEVPPGSTPPPVTLNPGQSALILTLILVEGKGTLELAITPQVIQFNRAG